MIFSTTVVSAALAITAIVSLLVIYNKTTWLLALSLEQVGRVIDSCSRDAVSEKDMRCMLEFYRRAADGITKDFLLYAVRRDNSVTQHSEDVLLSLDEKHRDNFCRSLLKMMAWRDPVLFSVALLVLSIKRLPLQIRVFLASFSKGTSTKIVVPELDTYHLCIDVYRSMRSVPVRAAIVQ